MKVLDYKGGPISAKIALSLRRFIEENTEELSYSFFGGWRFISEIKWGRDLDGANDSSKFYLDLQADEGGGSWAEAKMRTMINFDRATRPMSVAEVKKLLTDKLPGFAEMDQGIKILALDDDTPDFTDEQCDWLISGPGIAPGYGGLLVKFQAFEAYPTAKGTISETQGVIYTAFSGAKQWQDLYFAARSLYIIIEKLKELEPDVYFKFDLSPLKDDPDIRFWLDLVGLGN